MHLDFYGLTLDAPKVTCYLWSPWRASALEHRWTQAEAESCWRRGTMLARGDAQQSFGTIDALARQEAVKR